LRETPAIGVRFSPCRRTELPRQLVEVQTPYGVVPVKTSGDQSHALGHAKPEFSVCQALAKQHRVPVRTVWEAALSAASRRG
jgi:pyridinium-3,5-bisthiocarboxylic acid mononucleotide nickel chelatase